MPRTDVWAGARRKAAPGKAAFRRPSRRSIKVWICRYERAPLTIARIENRITPACPYIFPSARRRSGMAARQVRRSVVISNLRVGLLAMDSDRLPLRKRKDVLHGAAATFLSDRALNSPALRPSRTTSVTTATSDRFILEKSMYALAIAEAIGFVTSAMSTIFIAGLPC